VDKNNFWALPAVEQDALSDGYDILTDYEIQYDERIEKPVKATFLPKYQIDPKHLTPVKTQFTSNCWIYAAICSLETYLLIHGKVPANTDDYATYSETHFTYDIFDLDPAGSKKNARGKIPRPRDRPNTACSYSGNKLLAAAYFARGNSAVAEITDPRPPEISLDSITARSIEIGLKKEKRYYVSGYEFLTDPFGSPPCLNFINNVKDRVENYSSVSISLLWNPDEFMNQQIDISGNKIQSYYSPEESLIDADDIKYGHHAVSIIGWDDNYPKSNFKAALFQYLPRSDGAFLCRNSHGATPKWDGTFWLSYEDANMGSCACVTDVIEDFWEMPDKVYARAGFGAQSVIRNRRGTPFIDFSVKYQTETDGESLTHVGLFNFSPCVADVSVIVGDVQTEILTGIDLHYAGYHAVALPIPQEIGAVGTDFTLECTYTAYTYGNAYAPIEVHHYPLPLNPSYDPFQNIELLPDTCYVNDEDISVMSKKYGNVALYALMKNSGAAGAAIQDAYDAVTLPQCMDARIDLPTTCKKQPFEWRVEPVEADKYMPSSPFILATVKKYQAGSSLGIINTSTKDEVGGYITCIVGAGSFAMKKAFRFKLPPFEEGTYRCTLGNVTDSNAVDISGSFPVPGAKIVVTANNADPGGATVDGAGNWRISGFRLYKDAWDDAYACTEIRIVIYDDTHKITLATGKAEKILERPFTFDTSTCVATAFTTTAALVTIGWLIKQYCGKMQLATCCCSGAVLSGPMSGNSYLRIEDAALTDNALFEEVHSLENVTKLKMDFDNVTGNKNDCGGLAKTISKGGYVRNCDVSGKYDAGGANFGGLFLSGEDVTVSDCRVDITVTNAAAYGAVAYSLAGNCSISNVTATGSVTGDSISGIAENLGGAVSKVSVNLEARAKNNAAGIAVNSSANINDVNINGTYGASSGKGAGVVIHHNSGTVANVRVSAAISGLAGAAGIALNQAAGAIVKNCYVAGSVTSATGAAIGIASGVSGTPASVLACVCVCAKISGTSSMRISSKPSSSCVAYEGIVCEHTLTPSGEAVKSASQLLSSAVYALLGWDLKNTWEFSAKKMCPYLKNTFVLYDYPFPNPYPTKDGRYIFSVGNPLAFYGANNSHTSKLKWSISPTAQTKTIGTPEYLLEADEFYLQLRLAGTSPASYNFTLTAVLDANDYSISFPISIVE